MSEFVFILGAGASHAGGAPLMADFLDRADELRKRNRADVYKEDFDRLFSVRAALQAVHSKYDIDLDNLESVYAAFEMGHLIEKLGQFGPKDIEAVLMSMRRVILHTLESYVLFTVAKDRIHSDGSYEALVDIISRLNQQPGGNRCTVITFNYDLAADFAFVLTRQTYSYGLAVQNEPGVPLLKLHGSLNWGTCPKCKRTVEVSLSTPSPRFYNEGERAWCRIGSEMIRTPNVLQHCGIWCQSDIVVVPPTWNKTSYHSNLAMVWKRAARELNDAENVVVCGYSLSAADSFFIHLLALGSVGDTMLKRFWVFDPDPAVNDRYKLLLGPGAKRRYKFFPESFAHAVNHLKAGLLSK